MLENFPHNIRKHQKFGKIYGLLLYIISFSQWCSIALIPCLYWESSSSTCSIVSNCSTHPAHSLLVFKFSINMRCTAILKCLPWLLAQALLVDSYSILFWGFYSQYRPHSVDNWVVRLGSSKASFKLFLTTFIKRKSWLSQSRI
jgi:hypothetical protein